MVPRRSPLLVRRVESSREASEFQRILAKLAKPHRIAPDDPRKEELIELVAERFGPRRIGASRKGCRSNVLTRESGPKCVKRRAVA